MGQKAPPVGSGPSPRNLDFLGVVFPGNAKGIQREYAAREARREENWVFRGPFLVFTGNTKEIQRECAAREARRERNWFLGV